MTNNANIEALGTLVVFRGSNVWIKPTDGKQAVQNLGVTYKTPDLARVQAKMALRAARAYSNAKVRVDPIGSKMPRIGQSAISFGILAMKVDVNGKRVGWEQFDRATWTDASGWVTEHGTPEALGFVAAAERQQSHLDYGWARGLGLRCLTALSAISLPGGGVFYVHSDKMDQLEDMIRELEALEGVRMVTIGVAQDETTRANIGEAAEESLNNRIADIKQRLDTWQQRNGRGSTLETMLDGLADIRGEAENLATVLAFSAEGIASQVSEIDEQIREALSEDTERRSKLEGMTRRERELHGAPRKVGGAVMDAIVAAFESTEDFKTNGRVEMNLNELDAVCNLGPSDGGSSQYTRISVKLACAVNNRDPRIQKVKRGVYAYVGENGAEAPSPAPEVSEAPEVELGPDPAQAAIDADEAAFTVEPVTEEPEPEGPTAAQLQVLRAIPSEQSELMALDDDAIEHMCSVLDIPASLTPRKKLRALATAGREHRAAI